jgi:predicted DsbA family dithiol-disulfide isomerase
MRVEIWSDVVCPWCYVGVRRFERAVSETGVAVEVLYRSFELDPTVPTGGDSPPLEEYLARKYGDRTRVEAAHARLSEAGLELGIDFAWRGLRRANTFDAHRLLAWAVHREGAEAQRALKGALLRAYFTDGVDVADPTALAEVAAAAGLDRGGASTLLASSEEANFVRAERAHARSSGINAVPTFVVEGEWTLQGAHDTTAWVKALTHLAAELANRP